MYWDTAWNTLKLEFYLVGVHVNVTHRVILKSFDMIFSIASITILNRNLRILEMLKMPCMSVTVRCYVVKEWWLSMPVELLMVKI